MYVLVMPSLGCKTRITTFLLNVILCVWSVFSKWKIFWFNNLWVQKCWWVGVIVEHRKYDERTPETASDDINLSKVSKSILCMTDWRLLGLLASCIFVKQFYNIQIFWRFFIENSVNNVEYLPETSELCCRAHWR